MDASTKERLDQAVQLIPKAVTKDTVKVIDGEYHVNVGSEGLPSVFSKNYEEFDLPSLTDVLDFHLTTKLHFNDKATQPKTEDGIRITEMEQNFRFIPTRESRILFDEIKKLLSSKLEGKKIVYWATIKLARAFPGEIHFLDGGRNGEGECRADKRKIFVN